MKHHLKVRKLLEQMVRFIFTRLSGQEHSALLRRPIVREQLTPSGNTVQAQQKPESKTKL